MDEFENLRLHDAALDGITIRWSDGSAEFNLSVFIEEESNAISHILKFEGVSDIHIPHNNEWGESQFINGIRLLDGAALIDMQSGDTISITARSYSFEPVAL